MFKNLFLMTALLTVVSWLALAADIDGKSTAQVQGWGGNTQTQTLTSQAVDISSGTINGNNVAPFEQRRPHADSIAKRWTQETRRFRRQPGSGI